MASRLSKPIKAWKALPKTTARHKGINSLRRAQLFPKVYEGSVTLFWPAKTCAHQKDLVDGCAALAHGGMEVHEIPGTHLDIIKETKRERAAPKFTLLP